MCVCVRVCVNIYAKTRFFYKQMLYKIMFLFCNCVTDIYVYIFIDQWHSYKINLENLILHYDMFLFQIR